MKDYQFYQKYADLPLPERSNVVSVQFLGYTVTWSDVFEEVLEQMQTKQPSRLLQIINKYKLYELMSNYKDRYIIP